MARKSTKRENEFTTETASLEETTSETTEKILKGAGKTRSSAAKQKTSAKKTSSTKSATDRSSSVAKSKSTEKSTVNKGAKKVVARKKATKAETVAPAKEAIETLKTEKAPVVNIEEPKAKVEAQPRAKIVEKKSAAIKPVKEKISEEERIEKIKIEAYFIAEKHNFCGDSSEHWSEAEQKIDAQYDVVKEEELVLV